MSCQLPDVPLPWELERDARGLTLHALSGCVGWRDTCLKVTPVRHDLGRSTCLIRPSAQDHSALARFREHRESPPGTRNQPGKTTSRTGEFWGLLRWCVSIFGFTPGESGGPRPFSDLAGSCLALRADHAGSCLALRALHRRWVLPSPLASDPGPLTTLGLRSSGSSG